MSPTPTATRVKLQHRTDYRESYANAVQIRPSTWDFFLQFGTLEPKSPEEVEMHMFQGIYLSPQQAKAMLQLLHSHMESYEKAFGEVQLLPLPAPGAVQ